MSCDSCQMISINGVACHETGCPEMPIANCENCYFELTRADIRNFDGQKLCDQCFEDEIRYSEMMDAERMCEIFESNGE